MKKETRFSRKISDFFWAILSWLPTIMLLFTYLFICLNFQQIGIVSYDNYLNAIFDIFCDTGTIGTMFELIWDNVAYLLPDFLYEAHDMIYTFLGSSYFAYFLAWQILNLISICVIRLLVNVLMFLPKIGNYFISKWSGD